MAKINKCPACGKEVLDGDKFCTNCGRPLNDGLQDSKSNKESCVQSGVDSKNMPKKVRTGCSIGCLVIVALFVFGLVVGITQGKTSKSARSIGIEQEEGEKIDNILAQCGLTNINSIEHDELLDNAHFDGEKGYRVSANRLDNIILYLYADNIVYSVRYADNDLFLKGNLIATINDYVMSIEEISKWQVLCQDKVKSILKSPSTAKFPNYKEWGFNKKNGIVTIQGYVDSQNGFGAEIRSNFQFVVNSADNTIQSFIFDGQELIN